MQLFCDSGSLYEMKTVVNQVYGYTSNPTLIRQAGVSEYEEFICQCVAAFPNHSLSFEVIADEPPAMRYQARRIAMRGPNVFVKIPAMTSRGVCTAPLVDDLSQDGLHINITAVFTPEQVSIFHDAVANRAECYLSIFAGRIADTGRDPCVLIRQAVADAPENVSVLWASVREAFNIKQARESGAHIITVTPDILTKYANFGKDLHEFSRETSAMFYADAVAAGLTL